MTATPKFLCNPRREPAAAMSKRCRAPDSGSAQRIARRRVPSLGLVEACRTLRACSEEERNAEAARRVIEVMLEEEQPRRSRDSFASIATNTRGPAWELFCLRLGEARGRGVTVLFEVQPLPVPRSRAPGHRLAGFARAVFARAPCAPLCPPPLAHR